MDMDKAELIRDLMELSWLQGNHECRFMYCEKDEIAAEESFDEVIPLAKKYEVEYEKVDGMDFWEEGENLEYKILKKIEEEMEKVIL